VPEVTYGVPPTDPVYKWFSDGVESFGGDVAVRGITPQRWLGDADVQSFTLGAIDSVLPIRYALNDITMLGSPLAAALTRNADNNLTTSYTIMGRMERSTVVGVDSSGSREYIVGVGAYPTGVTLSGSLEPPTPLMVDATFTCKRLRKYRVDQPSGATLMGIKSTSASDTTQTVTVEDEDAGTSQGATLAGTTFTSLGTATYADLEAIWLSAETVGDVEVYENTGTHTAPVSGLKFATIRGQTYYGSDGDRGIPLLGAGTRGSTLGGVYADLAGSTIQWGAADLADIVVNEASLVVGNMEGGVLLPTVGTTDKSVIVGGTSYVFSTQLVGTFQSTTNLDDHLGGTEASLTWKAVTSALNHTLTLTGALKTNSGGVLFEAGQAAPVLNTELTGKALSIGPTS
jgi:hypothetical protein